MKYDLSNIVTIDNLKLETPVSNYCVVIGWSIEYVLKLAYENEKEKVFTFPFYTGPVEDVPDWSNLLDCGYHYLVEPIYVADIRNIPAILLREIERYLDNNFGNQQPTIHVELPEDLSEEEFKQRVSPKIHIDLSGYSKPEDE